MNLLQRSNNTRWITLLVMLLLSVAALSDAYGQTRSQDRGRSSSTRTTESKQKRSAKNQAKQNAVPARRSDTRSSDTRRSDASRSARQGGSEAARGRSSSRTSSQTTARNQDRSRNSNARGEGARRSDERSQASSRDGREARTRVRQDPRNQGDHARNNDRHQGERARSHDNNRGDHHDARHHDQRSEVRHRRDHRRDRYRQTYRPRYRHHQKHYRRYKPNLYRRPVYIDIHWPWAHRYHTGWRPRYQYRQVVTWDAGYRHNRPRRARYDVRTIYSHQVRHASNHKAVVDVFIERLDIYDRGRRIAVIDRIPDDLSRIKATIRRSGRVDFDRDIFIVGDPRVGFELISTKHYDGYILGAYRNGHTLRVGQLDLYRGRVVHVRHSRLFDPYIYNGYAPISLLPEDDAWLFDYGRDSFSANYYDSDPFYYGGYYNDEYYEDDGYYGDAGYDDNDDPYYNVNPLTNTATRSYKIQSGQDLHISRETEFVRLE